MLGFVCTGPSGEPLLLVAVTREKWGVRGLGNRRRTAWVHKKTGGALR